MLHHESQEVSDQSVTRLAMALYEADQEAARKKQALEQAAAEIGVPPHYMELARQQLARAQATHPQQQTVTRRNPSPALTLVIAFVTAIVLMGGLWMASFRAVATPPQEAVLERAPELTAPAPAGSPEPILSAPDQAGTPNGDSKAEMRGTR